MIKFQTAKEVYNRADGKCEARLPGCSILGGSLHHLKLRSRGGGDMAINLLLVCPTCHEKIHRMVKGTDLFRTFSWQEEGISERGDKVLP